MLPLQNKKKLIETTLRVWPEDGGKLLYSLFGIAKFMPAILCSILVPFSLYFKAVIGFKKKIKKISKINTEIT